MTELQQELLKIQYSAPNHQIKVEDLAIAVSKPIETINNSYGKLGHKIKDLLAMEIIGEGYWKILSILFYSIMNKYVLLTIDNQKW